MSNCLLRCLIFRYYYICILFYNEQMFIIKLLNIDEMLCIGPC